MSATEAAPPLVKFGSVRVRLHKMTLGDNPGGQSLAGPPVTLSWEIEASEHHSSIDDFSKQHYGKTDSQRMVFAEILSGKQRTEIAARDHTQAKIAKTVAEVKLVRHGRDRSAKDDTDALEAKEEEERLRQEKKRGSVRRLFGRRKK